MNNICNLIYFGFILFARVLFNCFPLVFFNCFACVLFNTLICSFFHKESPDDMFHPLILLNYTITINGNVNKFLNVKCSVPDTLHVFLIPFENYQYNFACLGLWNLFPVSRNWISPQYLSSEWCSSHVPCTRIHALNAISVFCIYTCKYNHHVPLFIFRRSWSLFFTLNIIRNRNFFIFIHFLIALSCYIDAFQLLGLNCVVDVSNCLVDISNCIVDSRFNSFGT